MQGQAAIVVRLLAERLAHPHRDRALDLTLDGERVNREAAVVRNPYLLDLHRPSLDVDGDFDDLRGITEAHRRTDGATTMLPTLKLGWTRERTLHSDRTLGGERCRDHCIERGARLRRRRD